MKITIEFSTDNAAFEDNQNEVETVVLRALDGILMAVPLLGQSFGGPSDNYVINTENTLHDSNGNSVGFARIELN